MFPYSFWLKHNCLTVGSSLEPSGAWESGENARAEDKIIHISHSLVNDQFGKKQTEEQSGMSGVGPNVAPSGISGMGTTEPAPTTQSVETDPEAVLDALLAAEATLKGTTPPRLAKEGQGLTPRASHSTRLYGQHPTTEATPRLDLSGNLDALGILGHTHTPPPQLNTPFKIAEPLQNTSDAQLTVQLEGPPPLPSLEAPMTIPMQISAAELSSPPQTSQYLDNQLFRYAADQNIYIYIYLSN